MAPRRQFINKLPKIFLTSISNIDAKYVYNEFMSAILNLRLEQNINPKYN
jgi:hypothetical protein